MRILQVSPFFYPAMQWGGTVASVYGLCKALIARGHEVTVFTTNSWDSSKDFIASTYGWRNENGDVKYFRNVVRLGKLRLAPGTALPSNWNRGFDIIHAHGFRTFQSLVASLHSFVQSIPIIISPHGEVDYSPYSDNSLSSAIKNVLGVTLGYQMLKMASAVHAVSDFEVIQLRSIGLSDKKIFKIPNGVDFANYSSAHCGSVLTGLGIPRDGKSILYVGRLYRSKGLDTLVDSLRFLESDVFLVLMGMDDGFGQRLRSICRDLGVSDRVVFVGIVDDETKRRAMHEANLIVYPTSFDIFGVVPLEAAAAGTPVVVSDKCGVAEYVARHRFGAVFRHGDSVDLADKASWILEDDQASRQMGASGRDVASRIFDWARVVIEFERVYKIVINS